MTGTTGAGPFGFGALLLALTALPLTLMLAAAIAGLVEAAYLAL